MVLTWRVRIANTDRDALPGRSRRSVLRAGALVALVGGVASMTGCDIFDSEPAGNPAAEQVAPLIDEARDLAHRYEAAISGFPELTDRLSPLAKAHRAHVEELIRATGSASAAPVASGTSVAPTPAGDANATLAELRAAEQKAVATAVRICLAAPAERAALLGSIAAARATHAEVLR